MTAETTQTPVTENASAEPQDTGSDDAAVAALLKKEEPTKDDAPEPEPEPEAQSEAEPEDGEPAEDEPTEQLVEVEVDGKTFQVSPEVEKAMLRQADYSRKMSAVQAEAKSATQTKETAERLLEGAEKFAEALAEVKQIDAQIKSFDKVNWASLRTSDPAEYAALAADKQTLLLSRDLAVRQAQTLGQENEAEKAKLFNAARADMFKALEKDIKGWGDKLGTEITQYAVSKGYTGEDIAKVSDPKWVIAMHKAMKYDALQEKKPALKAQTKDLPPVLKPGAPRKATPQVDAMQRLRKSNSEGDAIAAFLSKGR